MDWKDWTYLKTKVRPLSRYLIEHDQQTPHRVEIAPQVEEIPGIKTKAITIVQNHDLYASIHQACNPEPTTDELGLPLDKDGNLVLDVTDVTGSYYKTQPMEAAKRTPESDKLPAMSKPKTAVQLTFVRDDLKHFYCPIEILLEKAAFAYYETYQKQCRTPDDALPLRMKVSWWNWWKACNKMLHMDYPIYPAWINNKKVVCEGEI